MVYVSKMVSFLLSCNVVDISMAMVMHFSSVISHLSAWTGRYLHFVWFYLFYFMIPYRHCEQRNYWSICSKQVWLKCKKIKETWPMKFPAESFENKLQRAHHEGERERQRVGKIRYFIYIYYFFLSYFSLLLSLCLLLRIYKTTYRGIRSRNYV